MSEKKIVYLRLRGRLPPNEISGTLRVSGACLDTSGPVDLQLLNLLVCGKKSHGHLTSDREKTEPELKKTRIEAPPPTPIDEANSLRVESSYQGFSKMPQSLSSNEKINSVCEKINNIFAQTTHSPEFAKKPSIILNSSSGKIELEVPPMTKVIFAKEENLLSTLGFEAEAFLNADDGGKSVANENPVASLKLESKILPRNGDVTLSELAVPAYVGEEKTSTIKIGYGPSRLSTSYSLFFPDVEVEERFSEVELKRIFRKISAYLTSLWSLAKNALNFELVKIKPDGDGATWRLDLKVSPSTGRPSAAFAASLKFGTNLQKKLGLAKAELAWGSGRGQPEESGRVTVSSGGTSSAEKMQRLEKTLNSPIFENAHPRAEAAAVETSSDAAESLIVPPREKELEPVPSEDLTPCSAPQKFPLNYVIALREGEQRDFISERGPKAILALVNDSGKTYPRVTVKHWNQIEALHIEFIDADMQNIKLSVDPDGNAGAYLQADLLATFF